MTETEKKIRVCFVSPKAYPIFNPDVQSVFGGAEVDLYLLATELAKDNAFEVRFVVADYGQPDEEYRENVRVLKSLDFKQNPLTGAMKIWKAMKLADADWYVLETASPGVPLAVLFTRCYKCKFLYRTASQRECDGTYCKAHPILGRLFIYSLKKTHQIITQNQQAHDLLITHFGVDSTVIANGQRIPDISGVDKDSILWVGRSAEIKRPERFVELARAFPSEKFVMICQRATGDTRYDSLKAAAAAVDNLEFIEQVPFAEVDRYFAKAKIFVNTSDSEGFPNTFIQACKASAAILSLGVNPDGFIEKHQCGLTCDFNPNRMKENLQNMLEDRRYAELGKHGRNYVTANHDITTLVKQYKAVFKG